MANEITVVAGLRCTNGNFTMNEPTLTIQVDQATARGDGPGVVNIATTEETVAFGDISNPTYLIVRNLDATNYVQLGFSTAVYGIRLLAGQVALFPMEPSATLYAKANTAACNIKVKALSL